MELSFRIDSDYPKTLDNIDPLHHFRERFYLKQGEIYLCGNSVGLASVDADKALLNLLKLWKRDGVGIWTNYNNKYKMYSSYLAKLMAPLIKARPDEIAVSGSTTSNIHQAISTFYKPTRSKYKILVDDINFPTGRYAVDSQVRLRGLEINDAVKVVHCQGKFMDEDLIINAMTEDVALVLLPAVYYRTSQSLDMKRISKEANERDITIGWDLCHAIGAIELDVPSLNIDFAVWCTYKYLNGGPGSSAGLYINSKHFHLCPGLTGWYGNKTETQFQLRQEFDHQRDADGWQIGSPCLFSMVTLEGSLEMFKEAGIANIRRKSLLITAYLMYLVDKKLTGYGFSVGNPRDDGRRGGHVCLNHDEAHGITLALKDRDVVTDFRPPDVIRVTPVALYTSYVQVFELVETLLDVMKRETYKRISQVKKVIV